MRIPLPYLLGVILVCGFALNLRADESGDDATEEQEDPKAEFTFQVVTPGRTAPQGLRFRQDEESDFVSLVFHPSNLSESYRYEGSSPLEIFNEALGEDALGEDALKVTPVASFTPPAEGGPHILIFVEGAESGSWDIRSVPLSKGTLAPEAISFYNGLDSAIEGSVADHQPIILEPGLASPHSVAGLTNKPGVIELKSFDPGSDEMVTEKIETFNEGVQVVLRQGGEDGSRPFFDSSITISPSASYLMLIFPPENPESRRYRTKVLSILTGKPDGQ